MIEPGNKQKKVVAVAFDWRGWDRNGKTEEAKRYRRVRVLKCT
jgi:hypothetical protein